MEDPKPNEVWRHHSGRTYRVICLTNTTHPSEKFPPAVVYENTDNGTKWSRPLSAWHRSFTAFPEFVEHRCTGMKAGAVAYVDPEVPCDGAYHNDGTMTGGCGEPCRFCMQKSGEGEPPFA